MRCCLSERMNSGLLSSGSGLVESACIALHQDHEGLLLGCHRLSLADKREGLAGEAFLSDGVHQ